MHRPYPSSYLYGYRSDEVGVTIKDRPDLTVCSISKNARSYDPDRRPPMAKNNFPHIRAIPPKPDTTHPWSQMDGVAKRMAFLPPKYNRRLRRKFRKFVRRWCQLNLEPIEASMNFDALLREVIVNWLSQTNYPDWRKEEILRASADYNFDHFWDFYKGYHKKSRIKLFTKEEFYSEYKQHRGIWAREDCFKAIAGPLIREIEKRLFRLPYFIKKIPKHERPNYIDELLRSDDLKYQGTDFTSFESLFVTDMMQDCEFELYKHMTSHNPAARLVARLIMRVTAMDNLVASKYYKIKVRAKRMSGEMNTSLCNGFSNLMFLLFAVHIYNIKYTGPVVEGDDALIGLSQLIPPQYYVDMGLNVKMEMHDDLSEASFCGIIYHPDDMANIREPFEPLATTTWVTSKYAYCNQKKYYELLRAKALSLMFEYPGCPIIYNYGKKLFDLLHDYEVKIDSRAYSKFNLERMQNAYNAYVENRLPFKEVGRSTRLLMEKKFNVSVPQQILIEQEIENMTLESWDCPVATSIMPELWKVNYDRYVVKNFYQNNISLNYPCFPVYPRNKNFKILQVSRYMLNHHKIYDPKDFQKILKRNKVDWTNVQIIDYYKQYVLRSLDALLRMWEEGFHYPFDPDDPTPHIKNELLIQGKKFLLGPVVSLDFAGKHKKE